MTGEKAWRGWRSGPLPAHSFKSPRQLCRIYGNLRRLSAVPLFYLACASKWQVHYCLNAVYIITWTQIFATTAELKVNFSLWGKCCLPKSPPSFLFTVQWDKWERGEKRVYRIQSGTLSEQQRKQMMFPHRQLVSLQADGNMTQPSLEVPFIHCGCRLSPFWKLHLEISDVFIKIYIVRVKTQRSGQATLHLIFYCTNSHFVHRKSLPVWLLKAK